jgi:hypothetical protein
MNTAENCPIKSNLRSVCHVFAGVVGAGAVLLMAAGAPAQNLFVADNASGNIYEFTPNGGSTTFGSGLNEPNALAFNSTGDLFEADFGSNKINEFINNNGVLGTNPTLFASGLNEPFGLAFDSAGDLFEADFGSNKINEFINNNGVLSTNPTLFASGLNEPFGLAFDSAGDLFEADFGSNKINEFINNNGVLSTNPTLFASGLARPESPTFNSAGDLFEADYYSGNIYEFVSNNGVLSTNATLFASGLNEPNALAFNSAGDLFEADFGSNKINEFINNNGVLSTNATLFASGLSGPEGLAFSPSPAPPPGPLTVEKLQAKVNFNPAKPNKDTCNLTASPALESGFSVANQKVTVDIGDAQATFTLNAKGSSKSSTNSCKFTYAKKTGVWTLTASMKKGEWATAWATYGVTNATTAKAGMTVKMPVTVTIGTKTFATEESLLYKATAGKSGALK